jgi:predicted TIM-barrel fold metal-dependent hydrolase
VGSWLTAEAYLRQMDAAGIDGGVVATTTRWHGFDNDPAALAAERFPDRLRSVGALDVLAADASEALAYWVSDRGMRGMRLFGGPAENADAWLGDPRCDAVLAHAARLGTVVSAQRTRVSTIAPLMAALRPYPELRFVVYSAGVPVVGQSGRSDDVDALLQLAALKGSHISISIENARATFSSAHGYSPFFEMLCERFGVDRIAWGSYSMFAETDHGDSLADLLNEMRASFSFLLPDEQKWVFGGTARRLFWE